MRQRWLDGNAGHRGPVPVLSSPVPAPVAVASIGVELEVPPGLSSAERAYWDWLAPKALALGMLTPERVPGFWLLCQIAAARDREVSESGRWAQLSKELGHHLARFGLTADGKAPAVAASEDAEAAELGRLLAVK